MPWPLTHLVEVPYNLTCGTLWSHSLDFMGCAFCAAEKGSDSHDDDP